MEFLIKLLKFIGYLLLLGVATLSFMIFGWGGLILTILIMWGGAAIFFDD